MNKLRDFTTHDLTIVHWLERLEPAYGTARARGIRHLPVADDHGAIIGIISDRDFQRAMDSDTGAFPLQARVRDFMSWPVQAIDEGSRIADAARMMLDQRISALLVTREQKVVGIVTTEDLLRALLERSESVLSELKEELKSVFYSPTVGQIAQRLADAGI